MTYTAIAEWDGYNWIAQLTDYPGRSHRRDDWNSLAPRLVEVIKLVTGNKVKPKEILLDFDVPKVGDDAHEIRKLRETVAEIEEKLATKTARTVAALKKQGFTVRDIGTIVGVSHQRVQQLIKK